MRWVGINKQKSRFWCLLLKEHKEERQKKMDRWGGMSEKKTPANSHRFDLMQLTHRKQHIRPIWNRLNFVIQSPSKMHQYNRSIRYFRNISLHWKINLSNYYWPLRQTRFTLLAPNKWREERSSMKAKKFVFSYYYIFFLLCEINKLEQFDPKYDIRREWKCWRWPEEQRN